MIALQKRRLLIAGRGRSCPISVGWDVIEMWISRHRRHRGVQIAGEFRFHMALEQRDHHLLFGQQSCHLSSLRLFLGLPADATHRTSQFVEVLGPTARASGTQITALVPIMFLLGSENASCAGVAVLRQEV
jgi:hypothetical protein